MDKKALEAVAQELRPLTGGRIQRVDRIDEGEWVVEIRVPGRTLRLLVVTHPEPWLGLLPARPERRVGGGALQGLLRKRLIGRRMAGLEVAEAGLVLEAGESRITFGRARRGAVRVTARGGPASPGGGPVPLRFERAEASGLRYAERAPVRARENRTARLARAIRAVRKKRVRLLEKVERDRRRMEALTQQGRYGELLKQALRSIPRGAREAEVIDWTTGARVMVPLDPAFSARDNMKRFFVQARRGARGLPRATARWASVRADIDRLDAALERLSDGDARDAPEVDLADLGISEFAGTVAKSRAAPGGGHPLDRYSRCYQACDGSEIRVGKGAEGNDRLTASARGPDTWLHARGVPGAHVVLKARPGRGPDSEAVLDAAHLAAHFSSAKNDVHVDVLCTEARNVRKTKGAPAGRVGVARSRTLRVTVDPRRLARLLESARR